jgi:hypothetical protein
MHVARKMLAHAKDVGVDVNQEEDIVVPTAALLHDVGHGPFSHAFEKVTKDNHESRTSDIIKDPYTEINQILHKYSDTLPERLAAFFDEDTPEEVPGQTTAPSILTGIISSQLDADRSDYLLRDSYATGTDYGKFDLNWLLLQMIFDKKRGRFVIGRKAASAAEAYVFARYHMYQAVYFHKTTRSAEVMLRLVFERYRQLIREASKTEEKRHIVPESPIAVREAFSENRVPLKDYLELDDFTVIEFLKACRRAGDKLLSSLGDGIVNRRLYKGTDITDADTSLSIEFSSRAKDIIRAKGLDPEYSFVSDRAADTPYKPYEPDDETPATMIYMETSTGDIEEISKKRKALRELKDEYTFYRYYYPESIRDEIDKIANETINRGDK